MLVEFPHSDICGSSDICSLPQLIAACHVLRRLPVPRHPPCALLHLTKSVAWWRSSGLFSLTIRYLTLSESFFFSLVFSVNHWNCNRYPNHFLEKLLVFISISFSLLTCLYTKYIYSVFKVLQYFSVLVVDLGGLEPPASRLSGVRSNLLSYRSINS